MSRHAGELWVRKPTETLQYHIAGQTKTVFPEPHALVLDENIKDGDLVSLTSQNGKTGAVRTDSADVKRAYGFARISDRDPELDIPGEGELVAEESTIEIQTYGSIILPFSNFTFNPSSSNVGDGIFAVTAEEYGLRRGVDPTPGKYTLSRFEATTFGGNIIEVGVIGSVDTENEMVTAKVIIGGDSRGPVGLTEVEYQVNQLIPTVNTPRMFAYISNEMPRNHKEVVEWRLDDSYNLNNLEDTWLAFDMFFASPEGRKSTQKRTLIMYFVSPATAASESARAAVRDDIIDNGLGYSRSGESDYQTVPTINSEGTFRVKETDSIALIEIPSDESKSQLFNNLVTTVASQMESIFNYDGTYDPRFKLTVTNDNLEEGDEITTVAGDPKTFPEVGEDFTLIFQTLNSQDSEAERGGIIYFYRDPYLVEDDPGIERRHYITTYGQLETPEGEYRVVPADRRRFLDANASNADKLVTLAGALGSPIPTAEPLVYVHRGDNVMMQKMGLVDGFSGLTAGKKVYLGYNGHITQRPQDIAYDEYLVEVGTAKNSTTIDLRLGTPRIKATTRDAIPVGSIIPRAYNLGEDPPVPSDPPPGFLALEGQDLKPEEYPDLYYALSGETADEDSPTLTLHNDPSHVIKAYSFNLYPDSATAEVPVQALRHETNWRIIEGSNVSSDGNVATIVHNLRAPLRDLIGYVLISATDSSGSAGDLGRPMADAPQVMVYPGFGGDDSSVFGFQFEEDTSNSIRVRVANAGLRFVDDDTLRSVTSANVEDFFSGAENFTAKFVVYRVQHIYDFKDNRLIEKADEFWYDHRRRYYWDDEVEVHGVRATTAPDDGTLIRRDENERAQISFPSTFNTDTYTDDTLDSEADPNDITNRDYVDRKDTANRNWTDGNLQTHKDTEDEGIHGSSYTEEAGKLAHRDSQGRARVGNPSHDKDAANKGYVDTTASDLQSNIDDLDEYVKNDLQQDIVQDHIDTTSEGIHGSSVQPDADTLVHRDGVGKTQVATPSDNNDATNKGYVDTSISNATANDGNWDTAYDRSPTGIEVTGDAKSNIQVTIQRENETALIDSTNTSHTHTLSEIDDAGSAASHDVGDNDRDLRRVTVSTSNPSGGQNGDIWLVID